MKGCWMLGAMAMLTLSQCTMVAKLGGRGGDDNLPYSADIQRTYFEGQQHLLKRDWNDAYGAFLKCVEAYPEEASFHFNLAKIDLELERFEAAELALDRALKLEPENTWYAYHRGEARLGRGNGVGAAEDWIPFVSARPGDLEALMECADRLLVDGHIMSALAVMDGYEANVGLDEDVRMEAFLILQALTSPNDLGPFIKQAVEDFPQSVAFQLCLAEWHVTVDELDDASAILEPMVAKDPNDGRVRFSMAQIATKRNQLDEAFVHLMKAFPSNDVALEDKLRVLIGYGILAQSDPEFVEPYESLLDVLMTHHGEEPAVVQLACDWAYQLGRLDEALLHAETLVDLASSQIDSWTNLLAILSESGVWREVVERAEDAIQRFPLNPLLHYHKALALHQRKEHASACEAYRGGLAVVLDDPAVEAALASGLASCLREIGDFDASEAAFERSLALVEDAFVLNNHAYFLAGRHSLPTGKVALTRALECSTQANAMMPEEGNFMDTQAYVLFKLERHEEALGWILDAQAHGMGGDPVALEHEGDIRWAMGDATAAKAAWQAALDHGGDPDVLTPKLNRP